MTHIALTDTHTPTNLSGSVQQLTGRSGAETTWPLENWEHGDPGRHIVFQENWRGFDTWNTWQISFNPPQRRQVPFGNPGTMQAVVYARVPAAPSSPAPVPIGQYVVSTGLVNTGGGGGGKGDWLYGIRRR